MDMGSEHSSAGNLPGNPQIHLIEAASVGARADPDLNAVEFEVASPAGAAFVFLLDSKACLDLVLRLVGALHRLHTGDTA